MSHVTNISTYRFVPLAGLKALRADVIARCKTLDLKGTILLSTEGINLFVAGAEASIDALLATLRAIPGLEDLEPKISLSDHQPFNRMLVRIKKEIIAFGVDAVRPANHTSPKIAPKELKQWLDEGRPVTLLDTRNDYEVKLGTFKNAIVPDITSFRQFPQAVRRLPEALKDRPVVMFCTGGIRCEKAGPFMEMEGFKNILQLDGGILKYFEECGGAHYDGECFVFDQRVGVDPALRETDTVICHACQAPLEAAERDDPRYVEGESCPYCYQSEPERMAARMAAREDALRRVATPLPGAQPYENQRPVNIPAAHDGNRLIEALTGIFPQIPRDEWLARCAAGRFTGQNGEPRGADDRVRAGERILQSFPEAAEPAVATAIRVLHEDEALLVLHKPAPLPMHPGGRFNRNTLQYLLNQAWAPECPRPVHRLDANTTGIVLFARTRRFCQILQRQFLAGTIEKHYLVKTTGQPAEDHFIADAAISATPGALGSRAIDETDGQPCRTEFRVIARHADGGALLEARLVSGRTNQIRVHLWRLGMPVAGDQTYLPDQRIGDIQTLDPSAEPLQLHSWRLAFDHPLDRRRMEFQTPLPVWALPRPVADVP